MNKKTIRKLLLPLFAVCFLLTASTPALSNNIPEDTVSQIMPLDDKPVPNNPLNNN